MSNLAIAYNLKKKGHKYAHGGFVDEIESPGIGGDIISRVMRKRMTPGAAANDTQRDSRTDQYDDLVLRDDLEFSYDGENSGDHLGNEREDMDRRDIISRIMKQRSMKDRTHAQHD